MPKIMTGIIIRMPCPRDGIISPHHLPDPERRPNVVVCVGCAVQKER